MESLSELDLKSTKINHFPEHNLRLLRHLYLDNNYFDSLADSNLRLAEATLVELTLSHNILHEIPDEIYHLVNLQLLDLSHNKITTLGDRHLELAHLKHLFLHNNSLTRLNPEAEASTSSPLSHLTSLESLTLDHNQLTQLLDLELFDNLLNLTYLDLSYNNLTHISSRITQLTRLQSAHLYTKFEKRGLWLMGNPNLVVPPKEVWQTADVTKIFAYMASYEQRSLNFVYYARLVFVGEPKFERRAQLVDALFGHKYHPDNTNMNNKRSYHVVRKFYKRTENKVEFSVLDIGDLEVVGSLILSQIDCELEPTLFVIVFDRCGDDRDFEEKVGKFIEAILARTHGPVRIKLVGVGKEGMANFDDDEGILEKCEIRVKSYFEALKSEMSRMREKEVDGKVKLESLMKKEVNVRGVLDVGEIERDSLRKCIGELEMEVVGLGKKANLNERMLVREVLNKMPLKCTNRVRYDDVLEAFGFDSSRVEYAKTLNELMWLRFDAKRNGDVYLHVDYVLNLINKFFRYSCFVY